MPRNQPTEFGALLRSMRIAKALSQAEVAARAGVSAGYVGLIETGDRGDRPKLDIVKRIGQAVEATVPEMEALLRATSFLAPNDPLIPEGQLTEIEVIEGSRRLSKSQKVILRAIIESWLGPDA